MQRQPPLTRMERGAEPAPLTADGPALAVPARQAAAADGDDARWPPWHAYRDAGQLSADVAFVDSGVSRQPFLAHARVEVAWATGVYVRALRRSELDCTVVCDGDEAPKRRGTRAAASRAAHDVQRERSQGGDGAGCSAAPPTGAMQFPGALYHFFPLKSSALVVVLFKRAVPRAHRHANTAVRSTGNAATLLLAVTAPVRAAVRRFVKPRTVAAAVVPLAALRRPDALGCDVAAEAAPSALLPHLRLDVFSIPHRLQLERTPQLVAYVAQRVCGDAEAAPGDEACCGVGTCLRCAQSRHAPGGGAGERPVVGTVCLRIALEYLRSTRDDGGYEGPERLQVRAQPRGVGVVGKAFANHWLCAHNNVFCTLSAAERAALSPEERAQRTPRLHAWFGYGLLAGGAAGAAVHIFGQRRDGLEATDVFRYGGRFETDRRGFLDLPAPADMQAVAGHYALRAVVETDHSAGEGSVFVLEKGTPCVLFDLDGTLNVGDEQMVEQMTLDAVWAARLFDARAQKGAASVCRAWAARGYQCIYLSGRQGGFYQHTRRWLVAHGFPAGPIALTEFQLLAALPGKSKVLGVIELVGAFKRRYLDGLLRQGVTFSAAYGNTMTDADAYGDYLPRERIFLCGPQAGAGGTRAVRDWAAHLEELLRELPAAQPPIPNVNIFF